MLNLNMKLEDSSIKGQVKAIDWPLIWNFESWNLHRHIILELIITGRIDLSKSLLEAQARTVFLLYTVVQKANLKMNC
ncbi:uncharacterized protein MELLADRAFT_92002 [Melampsora larici-populina 98AG31]|uniref:Uncharacterized protein n=1 Tax=Melampsora larici-populina (strain 98AG31 / pathotype 3-4-7) TaxID=747676 RepID=F4S164_MELLP|nr:uncharacterized protein MELLADRAFT_92002 [Melampsora larici-populina 98AG31]EGG01620.1 hypothetical protein MELLADRAFT_92002 [Melampsora larici-populina 98AG31]